MTADVAIVGGGPAGLATAISAARAGLSVIVLERAIGPVDKACGEGLLPAGLAALARLGALPFLDRTQIGVFERIEWVDEQGRRAIARLPAPGGLGVRRLALSLALQRAADAVGVARREGVAVRAQRLEPGRVVLTLDDGEVDARFLVAADGLHSALRRAHGLGLEPSGPRRFGLRRHVSLAPWAPAVEVHFAPGVEAYVTPAGAQRVGVAFLWEDGALPPGPTFEGLLARFPALEAVLRGAPFDSETRGAGPLRQRVAGRLAPRFALVGDAAGYVDAITGEGLSLAFEGAERLGAALPLALARDGAPAALEGWARHEADAFARYARLASLLVWTARHVGLRRQVLRVLAGTPGLFEGLLRRALPAPTGALPAGG
jgi:2-polyprenyl-6-methoxyphenol hydroxylase-like FAD-dependent oxidoreductase